MSTRSSFRAALERPAASPEKSRGHSASPAVRLLLVPERIAQPVDVARLLVRHGTSLRKAHDILNRLAKRETAAAELHAHDSDKLRADFLALGVAAHVIRAPDPDVRRVRERLGLSQAEFALRFGLEIDTLQNWEQGRYQPDAPAKLLLKIIEQHPETVEAVLTDRTLHTT
jgi:DNA-binding transcriptional regulator YiaG